MNGHDYDPACDCWRCRKERPKHLVYLLLESTEDEGDEVGTVLSAHATEAGAQEAYRQWEASHDDLDPHAYVDNDRGWCEICGRSLSCESQELR